MSTLAKYEYKTYVEKAISYEQYIENAENQLLAGTAGQYASYIPMNLHRMKRISKTLELIPEVLESIEKLHHPSIWLVITEAWCGDASQSVPVLAEIAKRSGGKISLKIVYRDENLPLMDAHLTGESRSIPKLIQMDTHYNITGIWGPRPTLAQKMVMDWKASNKDKAEMMEDLHKWYADDKQRSMQLEVCKLLYKADMFCPDCFA